MKKIFSIVLTLFALAGITASSTAATKYNFVVPKAPYISPSLKPCIEKYKAGNYTGAMIDLEELVKKEKNNEYAKYYLALCYTKLGYAEDAKTVYMEVAGNSKNETLSYYSKRALACFDNPESEECKPQKLPEQAKEEQTDIEKFINSGRRIHPAAMDAITKERMEIRLQEQEYKMRNQEEQLGPVSYNAQPTNEEIAAALNTLSKVGVNPFSQNYILSGTMQDINSLNAYNGYGFANMFSAGNPEITKMFLYGQLNQQQNNLINYGI